jgi:hypothetical protein
MSDRAVMSLRTFRLARAFDEDIPSYLEKRVCITHRVMWWDEDPGLGVLMGRSSGCPCCSDELPMSLLLSLEDRRFSEDLMVDDAD